MRRVDTPETLGMVNTHECLTRRYVEAGLCLRCAVQAGYGHQLGWGEVNPPCATCKPIVATFPNVHTAAWRGVPTMGPRFAATPLEKGTPNSEVQMSQQHHRTAGTA